MGRRKVFLTFPQTLVKEPILWQIGQDYGVVTNIRGASITEEVALLAILLEGEEDKIDSSITFLQEKGVKVEYLEGDEE